MPRRKKNSSNVSRSASLTTSDSSDGKDNSNRGRLDWDQERDKAVYIYLLTLTDLGDAVIHEHEKINESSIAKQWGLEGNRIFVRRVLRSVFPDRYPNERETTVPGLTMGKLVGILSSLEKSWAQRRSETNINLVPRILTRAEKLRALRMFSQLSTHEREEIGICKHPGEVLLQQLLEDTIDPIRGIKNEEIMYLFQSFLTQQLTTKPQFNAQEELISTSPRSLEEYREALIRKGIDKLLYEHFQGLDEARKKAKSDEVLRIVKRELNRIEFQAGFMQDASFVSQESQVGYEKAKSNYLSESFIYRLTCCVLEHEILSEEFPIHLENFEIEKKQPLPLRVKRDDLQSGLLNPDLLAAGERIDTLHELEKQFAYQTKVYFYVRLPDGFKPNLKNTEITNHLGERRIEFFEEVSGVGSPISQTISAINRVLFWDIPSLRDYAPIARELFNNYELVGESSHSPVWSYTLVELCKRQDIEEAIHCQRAFDEIVVNHETAHGEYYGYDLLEVSAKSALYARLRAIKKAGIHPQRYLEELCRRIDQLNGLRFGKRLLSFYPFSQKAMEGALEKGILDEYRTKDDVFNFSEKHPSQPWSLAAYEAHLTITQAYLREGLYRVAKKHLDLIDSHLETFKGKREILSDLMLAKHNLCWFRYNYLTDLDDSQTLHPDRYKAVRQADRRLQQAEEHLKHRLDFAYIIDELPQRNFHPFFDLLSRVYAHRAKLYIFTPQYAENVGEPWTALLKPVQLLEKARIYAARDGDSAHYSHWSAYQSWCYLIVAYLGEHDGLPEREFSRENCIDWARRLLNHALLCYSSTGKRCYQDIQDRGGSVKQAYYPNEAIARPTYDRYGNIDIQVVPLIQEVQIDSKNLENQQVYDHDKHVLRLDLSILKRVDRGIYLFGTHACILLFAEGMLDLCEEQGDPNELVKRIERAIRLFTYSWTVAEDGGSRQHSSHDDDSTHFDRVFSGKGDTLVQGLHLHRLTQFADLGRIFATVCQLILLVVNPSEPVDTDSNSRHHTAMNAMDEHLEALITHLNQNRCPSGKSILGQERYNGHLAEQYKNLAQYLKQLSAKIERRGIVQSDPIETRNKIVKDMFRLIRGESDVRP